MGNEIGGLRTVERRRTKKCVLSQLTRLQWSSHYHRPSSTSSRSNQGYYHRNLLDFVLTYRFPQKKLVLPQHIVPTFDPDEQYDPNRPNDLGEYQSYRRKLREEKRAKLAEERRRKAAGEGSSDESSYYTDSEEEVAPRRDGESLSSISSLIGR